MVIKDLLGKARKSSPVGDLVAQSTRAVCHPAEREVNVRAEIVPLKMKQLRDAGFFVIGSSPKGTKVRKIWFIRGGVKL